MLVQAIHSDDKKLLNVSTNHIYKYSTNQSLKYKSSQGYIWNLRIHVNHNAKQKHPGCKKGVVPTRSSPTYVRPKALISAEAKKSPIKDVSNYLNDIQ